MRRTRTGAVVAAAPDQLASFEAAVRDLLPQLLDDRTLRSGYFAAVPRDIIQYVLRPLVHARKTIDQMRELAEIGTIGVHDFTRAFQAPCSPDNLEILKAYGCLPKCSRWSETRALYICDLVIIYGYNLLKITRGGQTLMESKQYQVCSANYIGLGMLCLGISGTLQIRALYIDLDNPTAEGRMETDYLVTEGLCVLPCGLAWLAYTGTLLNARTGRSLKVYCPAGRKILIPEENKMFMPKAPTDNCIDDYGNTARITSIWLDSPANEFLTNPLRNVQHRHG